MRARGWNTLHKGREWGPHRVHAWASLDALLVVLELHDERFHVLALRLPGGDGALGVRVEVLLLLVDKRLGLESIGLGLLELPDGELVL